MITRRMTVGNACGLLWIILSGILACSAARASERPNIVLITVDALRPDHLGCYGYERETSPALDAIAEEGVVFTQAISSSAWTSPGVLSLLTSLHVPTHGVDIRGKTLDPKVVTLPDLLVANGYVAPDLTYLTSIPNFLNLGFQPYPGKIRDAALGDEILMRWLREHREEPFFVYYHYRDVHLPYDPSAPYDRMFTPEGYDRPGFVREKVRIVREEVTIPAGSVGFDVGDRDWVRGLYDGAVREMDDTFLRPLLRTLEEIGLRDNTLLIVTADHGEELLDHGFVGHASTSLSSTLYDELIRIPLIMYWPKRLPSGLRIENQVQILDVMPTVLDLLGIPAPEGGQGRSLVPLIRGDAVEAERPAFCETSPGGYQSTPELFEIRVRCVRTPSWKLLYTHAPQGHTYRLYDLLADPEEKRDAGPDHPDLMADLKATLHRWIVHTQHRAVKEELSLGAADSGAPFEVPVPTSPGDGDTLRYGVTGGVLAPRWTGAASAAYVLEYDVGRGVYHLAGTFPVQGTAPEYGPFSRELWHTLTLYNPWKFRVWRADHPEQKSRWVTFAVGGAGYAKQTSFWTHAGIWLRTGGTVLLSLGGVAGRGAQRIYAIPGSDKAFWALLIAVLWGILTPCVDRMGRERAKRWGSVLAYTLFIFLTLPVMPRVWGMLYAETGGMIRYAGNLVVIVLGLALLPRLRRRKPIVYIGCVLIGVLYALLLLRINRSPAERLHLAEYGVLSFFLFAALRLDLRGWPLYALALLVAGGIGATDEAVQWLLPNRVFDMRDIGLNILSSGLGLAAVGMIGDRRQEAGDRRQEAGDRRQESLAARLWRVASPSFAFHPQCTLPVPPSLVGIGGQGVRSNRKGTQHGITQEKHHLRRGSVPAAADQQL